MNHHESRSRGRNRVIMPEKIPYRPHIQQGEDTMFGIKFDHTEARYPIDSNERRFDVVDFEGILTRTGKDGETAIATIDVEIPVGGGSILVMAHADFYKEEAVAYSSATCYLNLDEVRVAYTQTQEDIDNGVPPVPISHSVSSGTTRTVPFDAHNLTLVAGVDVTAGSHTVTFTGKSNRLQRGWVRNPRLTVLFSDDNLLP